MDEYPELEVPHCVINSTVPPGQFECRNCGKTYLPALPCSIDMYLAMANSFMKSHKNCEPKEVTDG